MCHFCFYTLSVGLVILWSCPPPATPNLSLFFHWTHSDVHAQNLPIASEPFLPVLHLWSVAPLFRALSSASLRTPFSLLCLSPSTRLIQCMPCGQWVSQKPTPHHHSGSPCSLWNPNSVSWHFWLLKSWPRSAFPTLFPTAHLHVKLSYSPEAPWFLSLPHLGAFFLFLLLPLPGMPSFTLFMSSSCTIPSRFRIYISSVPKPLDTSLLWIPYLFICSSFIVLNHLNSHLRWYNKLNMTVSISTKAPSFLQGRSQM